MARADDVIRFFRFIFEFFSWFGKQKNKYREIKLDEMTAKQSVYFGIKAICLIVFGLAVGIALAYGGIMILGAGVIATILGVVMIITGCIFTFVMMPYSLTCIILQLSLNRRLVGFLALLLLVAVVSLAVFFSFQLDIIKG